MSRRKTVMTENSKIDETEAADTLVTHGSKTDAVERIVNLLGNLDKDDARNCLDLVMKQIGHEATADHSDKNKASIACKGIKEEDLAAVFGDEQLSEEFKSKVRTIFEAAVSAKVNSRLEEIREELLELNEAKIQGLVIKLDEFVTYVAESWVEKNEVAIDSTLKSEINDDFMSDLMELIAKHNIELPEDKEDVVEEALTVIDDLKAQLNEVLEENAAQATSLKHYRREEMFLEACEGLTMLEVEKLHSLQEDMDFDPDTYADKLKTIKVSFLGETESSDKSTGILSEDGNVEPEEVPAKQEKKSTGNAEMDRIVNAISIMSKI